MVFKNRRYPGITMSDDTFEWMTSTESTIMVGQIYSEMVKTEAEFREDGAKHFGYSVKSDKWKYDIWVNDILSGYKASPIAPKTKKEGTCLNSDNPTMDYRPQHSEVLCKNKKSKKN